MVERTLPKPDTRVRFPSAALYPLTSSVRGFCFGLLWVWLVEAVCSLLLQGTRPRSASDTLMSRRNIPTSPLLRAGGVVGAAARCGTNRGRSVWEECAGTGRGNTGVRYRRQLAGRRRLVAGYGGGSVGTSVRLPRAHRDRACCSPMRARSTAIPS